MGDALAVDLGGTNMRAAVVAADGQLLLRRSQPTPRQDERPDALLGLVGGVLDTQPVTAAVRGVPGRIDHGHGALEDAPNLPLSELVRAGDAAATEVWDQVVVLGGGMGRHPGLLEPVRQGLRRDGLRALEPPIEVRTAALGVIEVWNDRAHLGDA